MSRQDAETVRSAFEAFVELGSEPTDIAAEKFAERWWHPAMTYEEDPRWPGSGLYRGRDASMAAFEGYRDVLGGRIVSVDEVLDGGEQIFALVRTGGTSKAGVPWDHLWAYVCRVQEGRVIYLRAYWDPEEAKENAGVS